MIPISDTEECVQASIDKDTAWHSRHDSELNTLTSSINQFLNNNSDDMLYTLCIFLTEPYIINTFNEIPEIAHCLVAVNITAEEFNNNITTQLYLKNVYSIDEVIKKNNYYKFLILNIEYDVDTENALKYITKDMKDGVLSSIALEQHIKTTCVDNEKVNKSISDYINTGYIHSHIDTDTDSYTNSNINAHASEYDAQHKQHIAKKILDMSAYDKNKTHQLLKNDKKFSFIICSNNEQYETECIKYIQALDIPDGYKVEIIVVYNASSMTSGYNAAMLSSDAQYKIYLHQDVFIVNKHILYDILQQFTNSKVGMIGMVGSTQLPKTCIMWFGWRIRHFIYNNIFRTTDSVLDDISEPTRVEAIDGFMMITQYDIPWREDIFTGWDFYDISQSFEFRKTGYDVIVPPVKSAWCFHDDGIMNLNTYYNTRLIFMKEYADMLH